MTLAPPCLSCTRPSFSALAHLLVLRTHNSQSAAIDEACGQPFPLVISDPSANGRWRPATARAPSQLCGGVHRMWFLDAEPPQSLDDKTKDNGWRSRAHAEEKGSCQRSMPTS